MWTGKLKQVGGSIMVAIPPEVRKLLSLTPNRSVKMSVEKGNLVVKPGAGRIGLQARLEMSNFSLPVSDEEKAWMTMGVVGAERDGWGSANLALPARKKIARKSRKAPRVKARGSR